MSDDASKPNDFSEEFLPAITYELQKCGLKNFSIEVEDAKILVVMDLGKVPTDSMAKYTLMNEFKRNVMESYYVKQKLEVLEESNKRLNKIIDHLIGY